MAKPIAKPAFNIVNATKKNCGQLAKVFIKQINEV